MEAKLLNGSCLMDCMRLSLDSALLSVTQSKLSRCSASVN